MWFFGASRFGAPPHALLVERSGNAGRKVKIVALVFTPLLPPDRLCCRGGLIMKKKEIVNVLLYNTQGATGIRCVREFCPGF